MRFTLQYVSAAKTPGALLGLMFVRLGRAASPGRGIFAGKAKRARRRTRFILP